MSSFTSRATPPPLTAGTTPPWIPGGWFAVSLDPITGRELERQPAFLPGYVGLYGQGPDETP